ncbi:MAG: polysulfide reductase NrfD [Candidatus Lindowbacteria bacterium]|nr:polysulfide reductase NrfD [Candidatus Lindowbacteria bacterium]
MNRKWIPKMTFWRLVFAAIVLQGLYVIYIRLFKGLGASTALSDKVPWGLWVGFDVLCGVGLAAGGFTITLIVHVFNIKKYKPILPSTVLSAFLGYLLVNAGLIFDIGRPYRIWHPLHCVPDRSRQAASLVVHPDSALDVLRVGNRDWVLNGDIRVLPEPARLQEETRVGYSGQHWARSSGHIVGLLCAESERPV